jgi:AraC-like DNA-binding protein
VKSAGVGQFISWNGGCMLIGREGGVVPLHSHYAIQIAFGKEHGLAFRTSEKEEWRAFGGALIPSRQPHSMNATGVSANAVMFVEPETREGRVINELYLSQGIAEMPAGALARAHNVFAAWQSGDQSALVAASMQLIRALTGDVEPRVASDERILRAIAYIGANLEGKLTLEEVAAQAFLSPSRFRHLFVEETGLGLRPYILWRRFLKVWELAMAGESISSAAHAAGFADAAHLTRTSRRMFGVAPSALRVGRAD